jgi:molecular chaperone GrpE (heat shock protein)
MFPAITKSLPPATQIDILGILQREQDHAMALLSSSPLLASLFVSYANQAAALEASTPSIESGEWKTLENTVIRLQNEINQLKPENLEMTERLTAAAASLEAFRFQVSSLKEVNTAQQLDIGSLRTELLELKDKYNRLVENSGVERDTLQSEVSVLKVGLEPCLIAG